MTARTIMTLAFFLMLAACSGEKAGVESPAVKSKDTMKSTPVNSHESVTCPVCGLVFEKSEAVGNILYKNIKYYFLVEDHLQAFKTAPNNYIISNDNLKNDNNK